MGNRRAAGHVGPQQAAVLRRLMEDFGVPLSSPARRRTRSSVPVDLDKATAAEVSAQVASGRIGRIAAATGNPESWAALTLRILAMTGQLGQILHTSPVVRYQFEYSLGQHRADLVCWHKDGGVSIIEAKGGDGTLTEVVAGIGQVAMYALLYLQQSETPPAYLKKFVMAPVAQYQIGLCVLTAVNCNVQFLPLPMLGPAQDLVAALGRCVSGAQA